MIGTHDWNSGRVVYQTHLGKTGWWFIDETADYVGPYETRDDAVFQHGKYSASLDFKGKSLTPQYIYSQIAHGDGVHRIWLHSALHAIFDGRAVPKEGARDWRYRVRKAWRTLLYGS